ncbi:TIR domain-containing protein [Patescibacteria group bacterium]|nr:TIR domain-containing protein [Patescibacteria group bacterium]
MTHKIFISYKYSDNMVDQGLDSKYWAEDTNEATGRGYVNYLEELIGKEHIYKGESDNEPLEGKTDEQIWAYLKPKVHDSSVTLIAISPGMKDIYESEAGQWIPQEVRYSLWEVERGDKTSATNALIGVILPDTNGSYRYIWGESNCAHCQHIRMFKKDSLFNILHKNVFNKKNDDGNRCQGALCYSTIYDGDHSYLHLVNLNEFILNPNTHIEKVLEIKDKVAEYEVEKTI